MAAGHPMTDEVIRDAAAKLLAAFPPEVTAARTRQEIFATIAGGQCGMGYRLKVRAWDHLLEHKEIKRVSPRALRVTKPALYARTTPGVAAPTIVQHEAEPVKPHKVVWE